MLRASLLALVAAYRAVGSPLLWFFGSRCRYEPSCSAYAAQALRIHPVPRALWLTAKRLSRCHPWGGHGYDPVPEPERSRLA
ncbi:membrane protein insertion efficiency factor YidD [Parvularcula oceani]|uniref:membrane protein insertion efficiency factor YidD n=1 Tax=Parvularcula oceani TaxID=1247963 RepID=UPI00068EC93C|nr:membrane protein insertion efficiency factor YidD [Parvularcula oceani]